MQIPFSRSLGSPCRTAGALAVSLGLLGCPASPAAPEAPAVKRAGAATNVAASPAAGLPTAAPKAGASKPGAASATSGTEIARAVVTGAFQVPAPLLGAYAGNKMVAAGGLNLVAAGAGNVIPVGAGHAALKYGLAGLEGAALAGARVYLADAGGSQIPGLGEATTDEQGRFTLADVPAGYSFLVVVEAATTDGKTATYQTLVKPGKLGATANVDAATTLVTAAVVQGLASGDLGEVNQAAFQTARQATDEHLTPEQLPDFTSRSAVVARIDALMAEVDGLKQSIDALRQDIQDIKQTLSEIKQQLAQGPAGGPPPQGGMPPPQGGGMPPQQGGGMPPQQGGGMPPQQGGGMQPPPGTCPPAPPPGMPWPFQPPPGCWGTPAR